MYTVNASHTCDVTEGDLVGADTDDRTIFLKERLNGAALLEANDVCRDPKIGDGCIPGAGYGGEGREEDPINGESNDGKR